MNHDSLTQTRESVLAGGIDDGKKPPAEPRDFRALL
jgi:hypothetical protein